MFRRSGIAVALSGGTTAVVTQGRLKTIVRRGTTEPATRIDVRAIRNRVPTAQVCAPIGADVLCVSYSATAVSRSSPPRRMRGFLKAEPNGPV